MATCHTTIFLYDSDDDTDVQLLTDKTMVQSRETISNSILQAVVISDSDSSPEKSWYGF
jgi:hypothetical protein